MRWLGLNNASGEHQTAHGRAGLNKASGEHETAGGGLEGHLWRGRYGLARGRA
jgi:hypothetical protein